MLRQQVTVQIMALVCVISFVNYRGGLSHALSRDGDDECASRETPAMPGHCPVVFWDGGSGGTNPDAPTKPRRQTSWRRAWRSWTRSALSWRPSRPLTRSAAPWSTPSTTRRPRRPASGWSRCAGGKGVMGGIVVCPVNECLWWQHKPGRCCKAALVRPCNAWVLGGVARRKHAALSRQHTQSSRPPPADRPSVYPQNGSTDVGAWSVLGAQCKQEAC